MGDILYKFNLSVLKTNEPLVSKHMSVFPVQKCNVHQVFKSKKNDSLRKKTGSQTHVHFFMTWSRHIVQVLA